MALPTVTVIVCAYKTGDRIRATIDAILAQTFRDFALVVIDDASGDDTEKIVSGYKDPRVTLIQNEKNLGIIGSRNKGISLAETEFLATCDHDDMWLPTKLEKQLAYMRANPECGAVGTYWTVFRNGKADGTRTVADTRPGFLAWRLFTQNCLLHSSLLMRTATLRENGICYRSNVPFGDDWKLCHELARAGDIGIIPESLVHYFIHGENFSISANSKMLDSGAQMLAEEISNLLGEIVPEGLMKDYFDCFARGETPIDKNRHLSVGNLLKQITEAKLAQEHDGEVKKVIRREAGSMWWKMCSWRAKFHGPALLEDASDSELYGWLEISPLGKILEYTKVYLVFSLRKLRLKN